MLLGSVPRPPKKPRSSISTQSARHSTVKPIRTGRISRGCPVRNAAPVTASAATATRFTANPCASSKAVKALIQADRNPGCEVRPWTGHAGQRAGLAADAPCQNPRPGQACSTAIPTRNSPMPAMVSRPARAVPGPLGSAISAPATA